VCGDRSGGEGCEVLLEHGGLVGVGGVGDGVCEGGCGAG